MLVSEVKEEVGRTNKIETAMGFFLKIMRAVIERKIFNATVTNGTHVFKNKHSLFCLSLLFVKSNPNRVGRLIGGIDQLRVAASHRSEDILEADLQRNNG